LPHFKTPFKLFICLAIWLVSFSAYALYTDGVRMPHKVTTYDPDRGPVAVAGLDFATILTVNVDGVPVRVELPGAGENIIRVTTHIDNYDERIVYEYDRVTGQIKLSGKFGERIYGRNNNPEMAYIMTDRMLGVLRAAFLEIGLGFEPAAKDLTVDKTQYVDRINPALDVAVVNSPDKVHVTVAMGDEMAGFTYDKNARSFFYPSDINFASSYDWDVADGTAMALLDDPYGGVGAADITETPTSIAFKKWYIRVVPFIGKLIISGIIIKEQAEVLHSYADFVVYPMPRLPEPEIVDISWVDKAGGLVRIEGRGGTSGNPPKIYVNNTRELTDWLSWSGDSWSVVNYSVRLDPGENKINAIIRGTSNREVESGDVTVYKGTGDEPDLILLSPRDRQVVWHEDIGVFPTGVDIVAKGNISPPTNIQIKGVNIDVDFDGKFNTTKNLTLIEGNNDIPVIIIGSEDTSIVKTIIGAYQFISDTKSKSYVLRRGDFVFDGNARSGSGFDLIPYEPNHSGIYAGDGNVVESVWPGGLSIPSVIERDLKGSWDNEKFYYATQVPKLASEGIRKKVVALIKTQKGKVYELPFHFKIDNDLIFCIGGGQYTPDNWSFYCSELAYFGWERISAQEGFDFGILRRDTMFPIRGYDDPEHCSVLPAFLCEKSMEVVKF